MLLLFVSSALAVRVDAQEPDSKVAPGAVQTAPGGAPQAGAAPKRSNFTPEERAGYDRLVRQDIELNAQLKVLNDLAEEHLGRADERAKAGMMEKSQWETDLANELRGRSNTLLAQLNEIARQKLSFETAHGPGPAPALGPLDERKKFTPDEFAYVTRLDERVLKLRQELTAAIENGKSLQSELQTNNTEEAVVRISALVEENARLTRQLEKEQSDLELKKLEFRALRK